MGDKTGIEWTDATWNPMRGCTRVSEGCRNCYAEHVAARFCGEGAPYEGLVTIGPKGPRWNGKLREVTEKLDEPVRWKRPRMIFVNSMSDVFHEGVGVDYVAAVFGAMILARHHVFQLLTKRPARMLDWLRNIRTHTPDTFVQTCVQEFAKRTGRPIARHHVDDVERVLDHVMLGVSIEDQSSAEERLPYMAKIHREGLRMGAVLWTSYEPALGPVRFSSIPDLNKLSGDRHPILDWVVVGGESGREARPFDLQWAKSTIDQCRTAGVACFVKQLGDKPILTDARGRVWSKSAGDHHPVLEKLTAKKAGAMAEWPLELQVRQLPRMERFELAKGDAS